MSKRQNKKLGLSRRFGESLWGHKKDPYKTKNYPPGVHGRKSGYKKLTDYGVQLRGKQMMKKYYGDITESQFKATYERAARSRTDTIESLVGLLESRLDAFVYRCTFVTTIFAARQFVSHKHVKVNGRVVNIASFRLKSGDVVEVTDNAKKMEIVKTAVNGAERRVPDYIEIDKESLIAKYVRVPVFAEVPYQCKMEPHLVVEFYSK